MKSLMYDLSVSKITLNPIINLSINHDLAFSGFAAQDLNKLQSPYHTSTGTSISSSLLWEPGAVSQRWNYHKQIITVISTACCFSMRPISFSDQFHSKLITLVLSLDQLTRLCESTVQSSVVYNATQHMILRRTMQWLLQNWNQISNSRASYGVSVVRSWDNINHVIMAPHWIKYDIWQHMASVGRNKLKLVRQTVKQMTKHAPNMAGYQEYSNVIKFTRIPSDFCKRKCLVFEDQCFMIFAN